MPFYIFIIFFITNIVGTVKEREVCYDIINIQKKIDKKENLTLSEIQFYAYYKGSFAQKANVITSIFWVSVWIGNYLSSIIGKFAYPYCLYLFKKYQLKKLINFIKEKKSMTKIIGYEKIVDQVKSLIVSMKEQKETKHYKKNDGILFYGPSGCGKTNFVKTMAYEADIPILTILAKDVISDTGQAINLDLVFEVVRDYIANSGPCILFFEEIDFLVGSRNNQQLDQNAKLILQNFLDTLGDGSKLKGLFIVGCTNYKENIDSALLRPGRFGIHIEVGKPRKEDIILFSDAYERKHNIVIPQKDELVNQCVGMSVSEVLQKLKTFK